MKKLLCITLSVLLVLSFAFLPRASAVENPFDLFDRAINTLRWHTLWDVAEGEAFPLVSIMSYMKQLMCIDEYGKDLVTENGYSYYAYYAIPADVFEAAAMDCFAIVNVDALRSYTSFFWDYENDTGIDDFQHYQPDENVYLFSNNGGMGDPSWYEVLGYTEEDGKYTVYSRFVSLLWDGPVGEEGVDYILIDGEPFEIVHYLRTVMAISNGRAQFHSWEELDELPDVDMTTPSNVLVQNEQITIEAEHGVFPADTVIEVREPEDEVLQHIEDVLSDLASDFVAFDIIASAQPNGSATVTFAIPEGYDKENLALFYISDEGEVQQLEIVVNAAEGTITAQLSHFSIYAVAQLSKEEPLAGDANADGTLNARDARLVLRYAAGLVSEEEVNMDLADINEDGQINVRDARAILKQVAGLS